MDSNFLHRRVIAGLKNALHVIAAENRLEGVVDSRSQMLLRNASGSIKANMIGRRSSFVRTSACADADIVLDGEMEVTLSRYLATPVHIW
jgi:hypothetical protein